MAANEMDEGEKCKSVEQKYDLICELPDCLIHDILSYLPSTNDAIRIGVLSKRLLYQWTFVPLLIFKLDSGMSPQNFSDFIDNALILYNNCSKIDKFVIDSSYTALNELDPSKLDAWIRFSVDRHVKELVLHSLFEPGSKRLVKYQYELPQFLFNSPFLVKLKAISCTFKPIQGHVNWASLKALHIGSASVPFRIVLSGTPVLECLEFNNCLCRQQLYIASESLKTLTLINSFCNVLDISCPNLEKLECFGSKLSFYMLSCTDLPPSVCAKFYWNGIDTGQENPYTVYARFEWVFGHTLFEVQHVEELQLGPLFFKILSLFVLEVGSSLMLKTKCLSVLDPLLAGRHPAFSLFLRICSLLEKLVIHLSGEFEGSVEMGEKFWELDKSNFDCLMPHLKTIEIVNLSNVSDNGTRDDVLKFTEFVLKNAKMLEKMVLREAPGQGMISAREVCEKMSCIRKASPQAIIKVASLPMVDDLHPYSRWDEIVC